MGRQKNNMYSSSPSDIPATYSMAGRDIEHGEKYSDDHFEYRHVSLPRSFKSQMPQGRLMTEQEWRGLGVAQSRGWNHFMIHRPEPHVLLFRRPKGTDSRTGKAPPNWNPPDELSEREKKMWL